MRFSTFSYCIFDLHGVGCNQPKARPGWWKFGDRHRLGQLKNTVKEAAPVDREKVKRNINRWLDKATDAELRAISMAAYHITKKRE